MSDFGSQGQTLNQSQAFAAALQRAKQIAAKIQPNQPTGPSGGGFKRSLDDNDSGPEPKRFTSPGSDYGNSNSNMSSGGGSVGGGGGGASSGGPANMSQAIAQAAAVAARLAATAGTTCEEQIRIPDSIANQFVGRGCNDTITHVQVESGCKVQLSQESDQIVTLRGSRETVTKGRELIQQLANRNGGGNVEVVLTMNMPPPGPTGYPPYQEIMIPGGKVGLVIGKGGDTIKQLQEKTGAKMVIIQDGPNQEIIKPLRISGDPQKIEHAKQLVLELIAQKDAQAQATKTPGMSGGTGGTYSFGQGGEQCEVFVPKIAVGVVIGKGGDMIRKIQTECGCKLQFIQGKNDEPGDRRCVINGTRQQVDDAKRMIEGLIDNVMRNQNPRSANGNSNGTADNGNSNYGYGYGVNHAQQPAREEITFMVPAAKCGIVIGRGGETIKLINQQSGAYCEMDRNAVNPPAEKLFKCKGTSEQVETARQLIAEKINMELPIISRKPISGNAPTNPYNQHAAYPAAMQSDPNAAYQQQWGGYAQQNWDPAQQMAAGAMAQTAAAGQADYSAQWIEYYKSMGMHREAEMVEQQLKAKQATGAVNPMAASMQQPQPQQQAPQVQAASAAQPAAGQAQDYSAQWAEYYRSIGKVEEAEAIEKQIKQNQTGQSSAAPGAANPNAVANNPSSTPQHVAGGSASGGQPQPGYPQGMTPSHYAQYSQYYAAAAAAGQQGAPGYGQQAPYGGYAAPGSYPGAAQPPAGMPGGPSPNQQKPNRSDKN
ncbi:far upstream element-binding protein 3-like isoform X3 [Teleopsis dalmanni]|uniref:far upstream element-binding protein 3-like isoform X3 n=1 Tax=Teleopsis dalmanni TaxID=139649 RepID=UPI0018CCADDD|nr:far upstream element-binding protein 3-like isoform X3 [Teleopsis dalmanni]XP_037946663.1 far upstream element-binding protein 3-like isoform X3 [Teleopsis dalmanni]